MSSLYHVILPKSHEHYVSIDDVMRDGLSYSTKSNYWYGNGGDINSQLTSKLKPKDIPSWVDFTKALGITITPYYPESFCFPIFTNKILVFDGDITTFIYDQAFYDENKYTYEEALDFDTGKNIEYWIKSYWDILVTLEQYLENQPFENPEILIFENVPNDIIQLCEKKVDS